MRRRFFLGLAAWWTLATGICHAADQTEIVLDNSVEMWQAVNGVVPRIEMVRNVLDAFSFRPELRNGTIEIGLRTVGGRLEITEDEVCNESELVASVGAVDSGAWFESLAKLEARGRRPLVYGVRKAIEDLTDSDGARRIVVITAGPDSCQGDLGHLLETLAQAENPIEVRFIGLGLDQGLAAILATLAPTRNIFDSKSLLDALRWATLSSATTNARPRTFEIVLTQGGQALGDAELSLKPAIGTEPITTDVKGGTARPRLAPGRFSAMIIGGDAGAIELANIVFSDDKDRLEIDISDLQPVTLEIDPEIPAAGSTAYVQFWGAPPGANWVAVARRDAPVGDFLTRNPAPPEPTGECALRIPDSLSNLELRFFHEADSGVLRLIGRSAFSTSHGRAVIEAPPEVENRSPMTISWNGPEMPGDHISIAVAEDDPANHVACIPATARSSITLTAPVIPGAYIIRYISATGRVLARSHLEVFEILATLEAPQAAGPGEMVTIEWTGPDAPQDFISIAEPTAADDEYLIWSPTASGNPTRLVAPKSAGAFEIRYVRAADGAVLARRPLEIVVSPVSLVVPPVVAAGTRFEVRVNGTAVTGDLVTIAHEDSEPLERVDWSFADAGNPLTLAAPFERGRYEVRYISGATREIVTRVPLRVQ